MKKINLKPTTTHFGGWIQKNYGDITSLYFTEEDAYLQSDVIILIGHNKSFEIVGLFVKK